VLEATSSTDILWSLETDRPEVLLLDAGLGADNGVALAAGLRRHLRYSFLRILLMSSNPRDRELEEVSRSLGVPVLARPFDFAAVLDALE
jgi:PleD family two-component response regulator